MTICFPTVGLMGKHHSPEVKATLNTLVSFLHDQKRTVLVEESCAKVLNTQHHQVLDKQTLISKSDLIVVIGGDGSLLDAARLVVDQNVPVIGVNRGRRGFLTDLSPQALPDALSAILQGQYQEEHRFLLEMCVLRQNQIVTQGIALNDVVMHSGDIAKMIDFQVKIDGQFVYRQRSDGLITSTPTGSTAYALAGGGPILHPSLDAIVLVPMHPPILSSRPIVVSNHSMIELHLLPKNASTPRLSCDGQIHFELQPDDTIIIKRKNKELRLLHPTDYDYYHTLRAKLGWAA